MSDSNVNPAVVKRTQETLGKYVKKPALTEKLLQKPPFRFLLDIFATFIKETGYFDGLYKPEELSREKTNDRDDKIKILQKMIDVIEITTKKPLAVRASKIVAGQEAEKTNALLQLMAEIVDKQLEWKSGVEKVINMKDKTPKKSRVKVKEKVETSNRKKLTDVSKGLPSVRKGEKSSPSVVKEKSKTSAKQERSIPNEKPKSRKEETSERNDNVASLKSHNSTEKEIEMTSETLANPDPSITASLDKTEITSNIQTTNSDIQLENMFEEINQPSQKHVELENPKNFEQQQRRKSASSKSTDDSHSNEKPRNFIESATLKNEKIQHTTHLNYKADIQTSTASTNNSHDPKESSSSSRPRTSLRPPSARPASARPGAPRRQDKNVEIILQPNDQIKVAGIDVKLEVFNADFEDDGENLVVIEEPDVNDGTQFLTESMIGSTEIQTTQQGHLVQQILETQKELVQSNNDIYADKEKEPDTITSVTSRKSSAHHMVKIRDTIDNITKTIRPLGKLLELVPEDIDAMLLELNMWRDAYMQAANELRKEESLTESATEPMKKQLTQLDASIKEYEDLFDDCRVKILQNSEKIVKLLQE